MNLGVARECRGQTAPAKDRFREPMQWQHNVFGMRNRNNHAPEGDVVVKYDGADFDPGFLA